MDLAEILARVGATYDLTDVHYRLTFPDVEENRLRILRFLLGNYFLQIPRPAMLSLFDAFSDGRMVMMELVHVHFTIDRNALEGISA